MELSEDAIIIISSGVAVPYSHVGLDPPVNVMARIIWGKDLPLEYGPWLTHGNTIEEALTLLFELHLNHHRVSQQR